MSARTLKLTSPAMRDADSSRVIERFQEDINAELKRWGIKFQLKTDGVYGLKTRDTAQSVCFGLGLSSPVMANGATPAIRLKVRNRKLTAAELARYKTRDEWRERLGKRLDGANPVNLSLSFARSMIGIKEHPAGSNSGPKIDGWQRACGVSHAPWCGCFVNAVLVAGGFPDQEWLRFCPWIEQKAKGGEAGWKWTQTPKVGDLVLYGRTVAQHVGFVTEVAGGTHGDKVTIEGNTSSGPGGSEDNGGCVAERRRHRDGSLNVIPIRGYARPPWSTVD